MSLIEQALAEVIARTAESTAAAMQRRNTEKEIQRRVAEALRAEQMTTAEACALVNCSRATLNDYRTKHGFPEPRVTPGGRNSYKRSEVQAWLDRRPKGIPLKGTTA